MAKVLVVDDDADLLALVARRLRNAGHRVQEAGCGADAEGVIRSKNARGEALDELVERLVKEAEGGGG